MNNVIVSYLPTLHVFLRGRSRLRGLHPPIVVKVVIDSCLCSIYFNNISKTRKPWYFQLSLPPKTETSKLLLTGFIIYFDSYPTHLLFVQ